MEPIRFHLAFPVADIALAKPTTAMAWAVRSVEKPLLPLFLTCTAINWWPTSPTKS